MLNSDTPFQAIRLKSQTTRIQAQWTTINGQLVCQWQTSPQEIATTNLIPMPAEPMAA